MIVPAVNYVIYGCSSSRTTPEVITIQDLHTRVKTMLRLLLKIQDNLKRQIKNQTSMQTCRLFLLTQIFQYSSNWSNAFEHLPTYLFNIHRVTIFQIFLDKQFLVDYAGLYMNWTNTSLFIILGRLPILKISIKSHLSSR